MDRHQVAKKEKNKKYQIFRIVRIALFAAILFVQEELLTFIPNVQLTQILITVYYYSFGLVDSLIIVIIHVILDNLFMGSFSIEYTPAMFIGWASLVLILYTFDQLTNNKSINKNKYVIGAIVGLHGIIYSWLFLLTSIFVFKYEFIPYLINDLLFEAILVLTGFVTTIFLLEPLTKTLINLENHFNGEKDNTD